MKQSARLRLIAEAHKAYKWSKGYIVINQVLVTILFPALAAIVFTEFIPQNIKIWLWGILGILQLVFGSILLASSSPPAESHFQLLRIQRIRKRMLNRLRVLERKEIGLTYATVLLQDICGTATATLAVPVESGFDDWKNYAQYVLATAAQKRNELFGFSNGGKYNFAIYTLNESSKLLDLFCRIVITEYKLNQDRGSRG